MGNIEEIMDYCHHQHIFCGVIDELFHHAHRVRYFLLAQVAPQNVQNYSRDQFKMHFGFVVVCFLFGDVDI